MKKESKHAAKQVGRPKGKEEATGADKQLELTGPQKRRKTNARPKGTKGAGDGKNPGEQATRRPRAGKEGKGRTAASRPSRGRKETTSPPAQGGERPEGACAGSRPRQGRGATLRRGGAAPARACGKAGGRNELWRREGRLPRVLVSSCLLGNRVRYDGGHKRSRFVAERLARLAELVPVCPEVDCGLPVPRPPMILTGDPASPRLVTREGGADRTKQLAGWAKKKLGLLAREGIAGYVCRAGSPSCGMRVPCGGTAGKAAPRAAGIFTRLFQELFPALPVIEDQALCAPKAARRFVEAVLSGRRLSSSFKDGARGTASPGRRGRSRS